MRSRLTREDAVSASISLMIEGKWTAQDISPSGFLDSFRMLDSRSKESGLKVSRWLIKDGDNSYFAVVHANAANNTPWP